MGTAGTYHGNSWKGMAIPNGGDEPRPSAGEGEDDRAKTRAGGDCDDELPKL